MKSVTFIHAADLHLDSPMSGLVHLPEKIFDRLQKSTFQALKRLIDYAIRYKVDFVILAGDLFDHEDRSIRAQIRLRQEMERLAGEGIVCFIVSGNHDHLGGNWTHIDMPDNVRFFGKDVETIEYCTKAGVRVHLYGFSYPERHVYERKIAEYKKKDGADFHIGILHGNLEGCSGHGNYAPFTLGELLEKDFDYWALGHIHKRTVLSKDPPVIYPGNTQGRNIKETGEKGCYLVTLTDSDKEFVFLETNDVIWRDITLAVSGRHPLDDLYRTLLHALDKERRVKEGIIAKLTIHGADYDYREAARLSDELLELLQEEEKQESSFVWPYSIQFFLTRHWCKEDLTETSDFYSELFAVAEENAGIEESLDVLYGHPRVRRFLRPLDEKEMAELKDEALMYLIENLLYGNESG